MNKTDCCLVRDLLPNHLEGLCSEETGSFIQAHLRDCADCLEIQKGMESPMKVEPAIKKPGRKVQIYVYGIRVWYFLCPFLALLLVGFHWQIPLRIYELMLISIGVIGISSQFFTGTKYLFDTEQFKKDLEHRDRAKEKWGKFYTNPLLLCLPAILVECFLLASRMF